MAALPAWISFSSVIPRACSGIQLKILKLLVLKVAFLDTVVKPRYDTESVF
ncbi:MAG TPA: palindromic element RPE4 domain-containing protein [Rickettsia endosymbiont of Bembidion lapponicum]|nr:palindromic element RPE4 domain-containing protein [Rickettsia endosymbiont of Bembidion lapponicum]